MWRGNFWWAIPLHLFKSQTWARKKRKKKCACLMQTYTVSFTCESARQPDSRGCKGGERSRTLKALATPQVSQTATCVEALLPRCTFHTFLKNVCFYFFLNQVKRMNPKPNCVSHMLFVCTRRSSSGLFFYILCCLCSHLYFFIYFFFLNAVQLKHLLFPASFYVFVGLP